eukprot:3528483-Heterocapsa_arctica.AAC.1
MWTPSSSLLPPLTSPQRQHSPLLKVMATNLYTLREATSAIASTTWVPPWGWSSASVSQESVALMCLGRALRTPPSGPRTGLSLCYAYFPWAGVGRSILHSELMRLLVCVKAFSPTIALSIDIV